MEKMEYYRHGMWFMIVSEYLWLIQITCCLILKNNRPFILSSAQNRDAIFLNITNRLLMDKKSYSVHLFISYMVNFCCLYAFHLLHVFIWKCNSSPSHIEMGQVPNLAIAYKHLKLCKQGKKSWNIQLQCTCSVITKEQHGCILKCFMSHQIWYM